jgi:hypothetical protein
MDRQLGGQMDKFTDRQIDKLINEQMERHTDGLIGG